ncbi:MAG: hypothetical protein ACMUEK_01480 [Sodalis sp. (in: enterobacteria)]
MENFHRTHFYETEKDKLASFLAEKFESIIVPAFTLSSEVLKKEVEVKNSSLNGVLNSGIFEKTSFEENLK